jgi:hypothetical protein
MNKVMAIAVITFMLAGISMAQERPQALIFTGAPG